MKIPARILTVAALLALSSCISGTKPPDTYTDHTGTTTVIETDAEQCTRSCNTDYSRCMDATPPAQSSGGLIDTPPGMFGAHSDCQTALKSCLPGCKSR